MMSDIRLLGGGRIFLGVADALSLPTVSALQPPLYRRRSPEGFRQGLHNDGDNCRHRVPDLDDDPGTLA
jgi:hypothetical protein